MPESRMDWTPLFKSHFTSASGINNTGNFDIYLDKLKWLLNLRHFVCCDNIHNFCRQRILQRVLEAHVMAAKEDVSFEEVLQCAISKWYPSFKDHTFQSVFIALEEDVVAYLNEDKVVLPQGCSFPVPDRGRRTSTSSTDSHVSWSDEEEGDDETPPSFPLLTAAIGEGIQRLGGAAVPKLNWSVPKDATWVCPDNTLKCTSPSDVYLLLKCSDFIQHDITRVYEYCSKDKCQPICYQLCLRKWVPIHPSGEFRCFVKDHSLIAICQRNTTVFYSHLVQDMNTIKKEIAGFYHQVINHKFPLPSYVFDVYRNAKGKPLLVDFNPFHEMTDSLLYSWEELKAWQVGGVPDTDVRVLTEQKGIYSSDLSCLRVPQDIVDVTTQDQMTKLIEVFHSQQLEQSSSEEEVHPDKQSQ